MLDPGGVERFEARFGLRLPASLVQALQVCNGGRLRRSCLPELRPGKRWGRGLVLHGLAGVGYEEGLDWSPGLSREWDYPGPSLVLCSGGPWAVLLDYRRCGADGEPAVVMVDTDHEVGGRPAEWTLAPSFAELEGGLRYLADRSQLALRSDAALETLLELLYRLGAEGPAREDYEGGWSLSLPGPSSIEPGPARLRVSQNRRLDGTLAFPELEQFGWIIESTVAIDEMDEHLSELEAKLPGELLLLHRVG